MTRIGKVTGSEIAKNKNGDKNVLMLQVEVSEPDDIQSIQLMTQSGEDTRPANGAKVTIATIGKAFKIAIAADDGIEPSMEEGEKKLYSYENETIKAFINLLKTGVLELNGNSDFAVRYSALEAAIETIKTDLNNFITIFNAHTQAVSGSTAQAPVTQATPTTVDITPAKIDEIKVP